MGGMQAELTSSFHGAMPHRYSCHFWHLSLLYLIPFHIMPTSVYLSPCTYTFWFNSILLGWIRWSTGEIQTKINHVKFQPTEKGLKGCEPIQASYRQPSKQVFYNPSCNCILKNNKKDDFYLLMMVSSGGLWGSMVLDCTTAAKELWIVFLQNYVQKKMQQLPCSWDTILGFED